MDSADIDCLVVGAGVIGLAIGRALARAGREVVIIEAESGIGRGISSRNSEVIHAGLYYPPGSLKARACVEGRQMLYRFCEDHGVPFRRYGKILVAADEVQRAQVLAIKARAEANGVSDLALLERAELARLEPALAGDVGLLSPSTGIIDSHSYMLALQGDAEAHGATLAFGAPLERGKVRDHAIVLTIGGAAPTEIAARHVVLAAGLASPRLARAIEGLDPATVPQPYFAKGNYFSLSRRPPFSRLIYPVPEPGGIGTHLTLDLAGRGRFGPDVEWLATSDDRTLDYAVDPARSTKFYAAVRRYWPDLADGDLVPDYSGVRPKIAAPGAPDADFTIHDRSVHGIDGLVALYGIESPGLTASLAIAEIVARRLLGKEA
jgi:L-2-hydroxyglutarate oxidase LhgO